MTQKGLTSVAAPSPTPSRKTKITAEDKRIHS
jgi:hypothetical protein